MNKVLVVFLFAVALAAAGCKQEVKQDAGSEQQIVVQPQAEGLSDKSPSMEERGLRKLDPERPPQNVEIPEPTPQKWAFLTSDLWHYEFALTVTEVPETNVYEGHWIDFHDDGTYEKGVYDQVTVEGVFTYDNDKKTLRIYPKKGNDQIREWEILTNGDVIIFVGTNTFGNNSEQIKLARAKEKPLRKVN